MPTIDPAQSYLDAQYDAQFTPPPLPEARPTSWIFWGACVLVVAAIILLGFSYFASGEGEGGDGDGNAGGLTADQQLELLPSANSFNLPKINNGNSNTPNVSGANNAGFGASQPNIGGNIGGSANYGNGALSNGGSNNTGAW